MEPIRGRRAMRSHTKWLERMTWARGVAGQLKGIIEDEGDIGGTLDLSLEPAVGTPKVQ